MLIQHERLQQMERTMSLNEDVLRMLTLRLEEMPEGQSIQMRAKAPEFAFGLPGGSNILGEFDPAGFLDGKDQDTVYKYREAELAHGRVAMLASLEAKDASLSSASLLSLSSIRPTLM